jgi:3-phosphoshikimate 1-carboxyvinyltransferase
MSTESQPLEQHDLVYQVAPGGRLIGEIRVPGDKSISHRSIMLGSLADGVTTVDGFLEGDDSLCTLQAFRDMGVKIERPSAGRVVIHGVGINGLKPPAKALYLGNSGTSMRLLAGLLAGQNFSTVLTGDSSLSKRPMKRVAEPLKLMGANLTLQPGGLCPIHIEPAKLKAIHYQMPMASAQVKSCLMLASLYADGETCLQEPAPCRDHTERMLQGFGYKVGVKGNEIRVRGGGSLRAVDIDVPADISSAAFFLVGASICPGAELTLRHVGINPTRIGVINILKAMGADIHTLREYVAGGEPVADLRVRYAPLRGIAIPEDQVPLAIDEFPALFIAAACADGTTTLTGAEELRVKESDRIQTMADGLAVLGVKHEVKADGIVIQGVGQGGKLGAGTIHSHGDHRIAMSFTMASLRAGGGITILDCNNVATSFPGFAELVQRCGVPLTQRSS